MSSIVLEKRKFTYEDYLKTPEDERYELIEGELNMSPAPSTYHQKISRKIGGIIDRIIKENIF